MPRDTLAPLSDEALLALYAAGRPGRRARADPAPRAPRPCLCDAGPWKPRGCRGCGARGTLASVAVCAGVAVGRGAGHDVALSGGDQPCDRQVAPPPAPPRDPARGRPRCSGCRAGAEAGLIAADRMGALQAALDALPDRQRQAVVLRHIEGLTNPEIAAILDKGSRRWKA